MHSINPEHKKSPLEGGLSLGKGLLSFKRHSQGGEKARYQVAYRGQRYCSLQPQYAHIVIVGFDPLLFDQAHCPVRTYVLLSPV
tara:strand:+ start:793 stop:1044 length:252 start_codon:yes stop_codon:yes gene_type:complete